MKKLTLIIGACCFLFACEETTGDAQKSGESLGNQYCFMTKNIYDEIEVDGKKIELADIAQLSLTINDDEVFGRYDYIPGEKDARWGEFKGTIDDNGKITGSYISIQEGTTNKVTMDIELKDDVALVDGETLPKADCADLETPPDYAVNLTHEVEDIYTGTYTYESKNASGSIDIEMIDENTLQFSISIGSSSCTGDVSGNAIIEYMGLAIYSDEMCGNLFFEFSDNTLSVREEDCSDYHGMRCSFNESYTKENTSKSTGSNTKTLRLIGDKVNVRSKPSIKSDVVLQLKINEVLDIKGKTKETTTIQNQTDYWYQIEKNGKQGWVFGALTTETLNEKVDAEDGSSTIEILGDKVNVRSKPSTKGEVIMQLNYGQVATVKKQSSNYETIGYQTDYWYQIEINGKRGWVFGALTSLQLITEGCSG
jgi:SH3-like domain-containing protein